MRQRHRGGLLLTVGAVLIFMGFAVIAVDVYPDGQMTVAAIALYVLVFILPGLVVMGIGARMGRRDPRGG